MGGPLHGYDNLTHDFGDQLKVYEDKFQRSGILGPEIDPDGWIPKINAVIQEEVALNSDLVIYYGGVFFFPRIFLLVKEDLFYAIFSLVLVLAFMWLQFGSVFLAAVGMCGILGSFVVALAIWKALGNASFTFMQGMSI